MADDYIVKYAMPGRKSNFTITLGEMIALGYDTAGKLGLDDYPIFDETYRAYLNERIIAHFAMREIGVETPKLFTFYVRRTMWEQMPYFNQRYESTRRNIDPLLTMSYTAATDSSNRSDMAGRSTATQSTTSDSASTSDSTAGTTSKTVNSELPQTRVDDFSLYATSASESATDSTSHQSSDTHSTSETNAVNSTESNTANSTGSITTTTTGYTGSPADLLRAWRDSFINVDLEVIGSLESCFMQVWGSGDDMRPHPLQVGLEW